MDTPQEALTLPADTPQTRQDSTNEKARTRYGGVRLRTLADLDGRTAAARRFRELVADYTLDHSSEFGGGVTTAQAAIIQRAVSLQIWCENAEARYAETGELDIAAYTTVTNSLRRLLSDLGLERRNLFAQFGNVDI